MNVRGINNSNKRRSIFNLVRKRNADFAFLQETYSSVENEIPWRNEWGGKILFSHGTKHSRGTMILVNPKFDCEILDCIHEPSGRIIILEIKIDETKVALINVYAPVEENQQINFFRELTNLIRKQNYSNDHLLILGGDFNNVLETELDKKGGQSRTKEKARHNLKKLMEEFYLIDIWRIKNPGKKKFTWRQHNPLIQCRLDFFLVSDTFQDNVVKSDILPAFKSDHSGIAIHLQDVKYVKRGPNYWKFNTSLLENDRYTKELMENLENWKKECPQFNYRQKWDWIKYNIRRFSINFSKIEAKRRKDEILEVEKQLEILEHNLNSQNLNQYQNLKQQYESLMEEKTEGSMMRAKVRWYEQGEKSTKYFYNLEKRNYHKKTMTKLTTENGITEDPKQILKEQKLFYEDLYSSKKKHDRRTSEIEKLFLNSETLPKLDPSDQLICEGKLNESECHKVLKSFKPNKSPGNDGIPIELLKFIWPNISSDLVAAFNEAHELGSLSISQRQAVITLVEKKGKDRTYIRNWRPISLLNTDYKIASKALANRLIPLLPKLIHSDQTGYVTGRNMSDTLRSILDIMTYTEHKKIPGLMICLDFQKAFDTLEKDFMLKALRAFNFGESFIQWIKTLYTDISSCVMNNGYSSGYFNVHRGVRQGDPMSPYLFIIALELLAHRIRENDKIEGIQIGDCEKKLSQFADDSTCLVGNTNSVKHLLQTLKDFAKISGLKINKDKTEWMWIGSKRGADDQIEGLPIQKQRIKLLGVIISHNLKEMTEINLENKLTEMSNTFQLWKMRNLTIEGRILLAKSLGVSKFSHIIAVLEIPGSYIKRIEACLFSFVWKGKRDKVKRSILISDVEDGGLRMTSIKAVCEKTKIQWIQRYLAESDATWKKILDEYLKPYGGTNLFLLCNYEVKNLKHIFPPHYYMHSVLNEWKSFLNETNTKQSHFIWNNSDIKIDGRTIFNSELFSSGIWFPSDLYENKEVIPFETWTQRGISKKHYFLWHTLIVASAKFKSLPKLISNEMLQITLTGKCISFQKIPSQLLYKYFVSLECTQGPTNRKKMEEKYGPLNWQSIMSLTRKTTVNTRLRELQYKITNNFLTTNRLLKIYKIKDTDRCDLCFNYTETIEHLFWDCHKSRTLWLVFENWWSEKTKLIYPELEKNTVLFGSFRNLPNELLYNHIILIIKNYIFKNKDKTISLTQVLNIIRHTQKIEFYIAKKNNKIYKYLRKWEIILKALI